MRNRSRKSYAGVGSRKITSNQSLMVSRASFALALMGYKANTGRAIGTDLSVEFGVIAAVSYLRQLDPSIKLSDYLSCYLPWDGFNGKRVSDGYIVPAGNRHIEYSKSFHPDWSALKNSGKLLMGRNACQVLEENLSSPVSFLLGLTPDGAISAKETTHKTGGTGQAIRIADANSVPIFNLMRPDHQARIMGWVDSFCDQWTQNHGVNPLSIIDSAFVNHMGFDRVIEGNLISLANDGHVDILVHGLSCQNTAGKGFAESLFSSFPEAMEADRKTAKGSRLKLGTYSMAKAIRQGKEIIIINAYTQFRYSNDDVLSCDYEAMRKVFGQINKDFPGRQIHIPKIGAGLARGCWVSCSHIIKNELKNLPDPVLVIYNKNRPSIAPPAGHQSQLELL